MSSKKLSAAIAQQYIRKKTFRYMIEARSLDIVIGTIRSYDKKTKLFTNVHEDQQTEELDLEELLNGIKAYEVLFEDKNHDDVNYSLCLIPGHVYFTSDEDADKSYRKRTLNGILKDQLKYIKYNADNGVFQNKIKDVPRGAIVYHNPGDKNGNNTNIYYQFRKGDYVSAYKLKGREKKLKANTYELFWLDRFLNNTCVDDEIQIFYMRPGHEVYWTHVRSKNYINRSRQKSKDSSDGKSSKGSSSRKRKIPDAKTSKSAKSQSSPINIDDDICKDGASIHDKNDEFDRYGINRLRWPGERDLFTSKDRDESFSLMVESVSGEADGKRKITYFVMPNGNNTNGNNIVSKWFTMREWCTRFYCHREYAESKKSADKEEATRKKVRAKRKLIAKESNSTPKDLVDLVSEDEEDKSSTPKSGTNSLTPTTTTTLNVTTSALVNINTNGSSVATTTTAVVKKKSSVKKPVVEKQAVKRKNKRRKIGKYIGKRTLEWAEVNPNNPEEELWCFGTVTQKKNTRWIIVYDDDVSNHPKWYDQREMVESEVKYAIGAYNNPAYKKHKKYKE
tara:strand:+ start:433 stop:2121 length:1689 start_codon:yes stop_codon:yes gene_type:complete